MEHPVQIPTLNLTMTDPSIPGWHRETTFLQSYPSGRSDPVILVVGAYNGTIAGLLIEQMPEARYYLFEPQDFAAKRLREKFGHLPNVKVCEFALGDRSGTFQMALYGTDSCSFMRGLTPLTPGHEAFFDARMEEFGAFMEREKIEEVYYASVNIESYELVLLPHLVDTGWLEKIETVGISWHHSATWKNKSTTSYGDIQDMLAEDHELVLGIDNWQSWKRQDMPDVADPSEETEKGEFFGETKGEEPSDDESPPTVCLEPDCNYVVPKGKDPVLSLAAHSRGHK